MALPERDSKRVVIAGASSLLGIELKSLLEESRLADADFRLLDEDVAVGTLTEAGGEAAVIQPWKKEVSSAPSLSSSPARRNSHAPTSQPRAIRRENFRSLPRNRENRLRLWFPKLDHLLGANFPRMPPLTKFLPGRYRRFRVTLALAKLVSASSRSLLFLRLPKPDASVSKNRNTNWPVALLPGVGQPVFDAQVAFNMLTATG